MPSPTPSRLQIQQGLAVGHGDLGRQRWRLTMSWTQVSASGVGAWPASGYGVTWTSWTSKPW